MNTDTDNAQKQYTGTATYSPEDNKLRLYIGRVPREEYLALKAEGWTTLHKQRDAGGGDFAAVWTPARLATALSYAGIVEDEDMGPEERAADRAERFSGYLEKRMDEAGGHADRYDNGPHVHGYQSEARAVRAADRHDRVASRAVDAWDKAEYWQRRTAGVIAHRLHLSSPAVRMGRIKTIEADQRKTLASLEEYAKNWRNWCKLRDIEDAQKQTELVLHYVGHSNQWSDYMHPRAEKLGREYYRNNKVSLYSLMTCEEDPITGAEAVALWFSNHGEPKLENAWTRHYELRLAYENQMLEAQGGRAAMVEMEVGGWIGKHQIRKVNKSNATGRVVSVTLRMQGNRWGNEAKPGEWYERPFNIERLPKDAYRAPTDEEKEEFAQKKRAEKAAIPKADPCPLINPTDEDAQRLQDIINEHHVDAWKRHHGQPTEHYKPKTAEVERITQALYSANSKGAYARAETRELHANGELSDRNSNMYCRSTEERRKRIGKPLCKVRIAGYDPVRILVITDKPQKPFPLSVWQKAQALEPITA